MCVCCNSETACCFILAIQRYKANLLQLRKLLQGSMGGRMCTVEGLQEKLGLPKGVKPVSSKQVNYYIGLVLLPMQWCKAKGKRYLGVVYNTSPNTIKKIWMLILL